MNFVEMPPKKRPISSETVFEQFDIYELFLTEDENDDFLGFEVTSANENDHSLTLQEIFSKTSDEEEDFLGFENTSTDSQSDLNAIFYDNSNTEEFFGF